MNRHALFCESFGAFTALVCHLHFEMALSHEIAVLLHAVTTWYLLWQGHSYPTSLSLCFYTYVPPLYKAQGENPSLSPFLTDSLRRTNLLTLPNPHSALANFQVLSSDLPRCRAAPFPHYSSPIGITCFSSFPSSAPTVRQTAVPFLGGRRTGKSHTPRRICSRCLSSCARGCRSGQEAGANQAFTPRLSHCECSTSTVKMRCCKLANCLLR